MSCLLLSLQHLISILLLIRSRLMKKILIVAPILFDWKEVSIIQNSIKSLNDIYQIDYCDPLSICDLEYGKDFADRFFKLWQSKLSVIGNNYDAIIGFSFGGVILCQCLHLLVNKKIILISTPTLPSKHLKFKLLAISNLLKVGKLFDALKLHNGYVFAPFSNPIIKIDHDNKNNIAGVTRLILGYDLLLHANLIECLTSSPVDTINLIGDLSELVTNHDVFFNYRHHIVIVPNSGMRVLQNNSDFCFNIIAKYIQEDNFSI